MLFLRKFILYSLFLYLLAHSSILKGEYTDIRFNRITINEGLSLSSVYCIFQDSKGFMWFGTEDGLNKYDGENFIVYRALSNSNNSLANKWIELIYEDNLGIFWFGSRGGLTRFDPYTETFLQYKSSLPEPHQLLNDTVTQIYQVSNDQILIGTSKGLNQIDLKTLECSEAPLSDISSNSSVVSIEPVDKENYVIAFTNGLFQVNATKNKVCPIQLDNNIRIKNLTMHENRVWIGTDNGIYFYNNIDCDKSNESIRAKKLKEAGGINVDQILIDEAANMWISTEEGLYRKDTTSKIKLLILSLTLSHSLALVTTENLLQDLEGNIWYTTHGNGVYRIDKQSGEVENLKNNPCDHESLSENSINCIYQDKSGSLWFGTFGAGISVYSPFAHKFKLLHKDPMRENTLASNFVWSILEDSKGRIWIGTNDKGISLYSPKTKHFTHFDHEQGNPNSLPQTSVREIYEDSEGIIWIGTDGGGLGKFNEKTESFFQYYAGPANQATLSDNSVRVVYEDKAGYLWIGTRNGLNRFDKKSYTFKQYLHDPENDKSISHNFVYSAIVEDSQSNLWVGTYGGGLNKLDAENDEFERFVNDPENPNTLSDNIVFSIYEDEKGMIWIGTNSGLNKYNPTTDQFNRFGFEHGLPNEVIYGILPDNSGNLWLSTNLGICRFNKHDSTVINYNVTHGLQSNEFNGGAFHRGYSGNLYFGGVYGLNFIDPDVVGENTDHSQLVLSGLEILGNDVKVRSGVNNNKRNRVVMDSVHYFIPQHISYAKELLLDYDIRYFSLEFVDLGNMNNSNISYAYIMEGLDDSWHNSGSRNYVLYANIPPGKYTFKVKSQQSDGSWSESIAKLDIHITPPFWKTWWFIICELVILLVVVFSIYRYLLRLRTYRILKIQNERINLANQKLTESEENLMLMNATKDKFFSIISHDLKNPFASLLSISETMSDNFDSFENEEKRISVQKIHTSIKHIYHLLENLLTWSRTQSGKIQFNPTRFNLTLLLNENYNIYQLTANKKNIKLISNFQDDCSVYGDRDMINSVIRNLLNNALKFTPISKSVEIGTKEMANEIEIYIKDEGVGISNENLQKLFRIDQKIKTSGTSGEQGTGLGLIICKEFVEKNKGQIQVDTAPGKGSVFSFTVPK